MKFHWRRVLVVVTLLTIGWLMSDWVFHPIRTWMADDYWCRDGQRILYGKKACGL